MGNTLGDFNPQSKWSNVARELRQYRKAQLETWGTIDDVTIGRYLAGEATSKEIAEVESAMQTYPAVKEAIRIAKEVLNK